LVLNEGWQPVLFESAQDFLAERHIGSEPDIRHLPTLSALDLQQAHSSEDVINADHIYNGYENSDVGPGNESRRSRVLTKPFDDSGTSERFAVLAPGSQ